jgi:RNA polymerase sigma factor (sigma-70 family)
MDPAELNRPDRAHRARKKSGESPIYMEHADAGSIDAQSLAEIERSLHGKLRAHRLSEAFIARASEDAIGQSLTEYVGALRRGKRIENPNGWIVNTAWRRALNQLRREVRHVDRDGAELAMESEGDGATVEEEAIGRTQVGELREAIGVLSAQERQALSLYYFEERTTREAAKLLGCGEGTFRRRRDAALSMLRERLGITAPETGDELAIEIGLLAWLSLSKGARVPPTRAPIDQITAAASRLHHGISGLLGRGRDLLARLLSSNAGEGIGAAASGPLGKTAGVCAGALTACALTGVIGPGVGGVNLVGESHQSAPKVHRTATGPTRHEPAAATHTRAQPEPPSPQNLAASRSTQAHSSPHESAPARHKKEATRAVASQEIESAAPSSEPVESAPTAESSTPSTPPASHSQSPSAVANQQFSP